jgi:hypothetical protein
VAVRFAWSVLARDADRPREYHQSRIEVLSGERAGEVAEEDHKMTAWTASPLAAAVAQSPFRRTAIYDGDQTGWPRVDPAAVGGLLWHELARRDAV